MKLGTWNVALPVAARRRDALRAHTNHEDADVWVLTETHDGFTLGHAHSHSSAAGRDGLHKREHRWVTIWSRYPLQELETTDRERTAAARVNPAGGAPFVVFGTVLPWIGSPWRGHPSAGGIAFRESLAVQAADWVRIRREWPDDELFVLGDFNQDLVKPRYYGSKANRARLEERLGEAGLVALTGGNADPIRRDSPMRGCIDHICARSDSKWRVDATKRWPDLAAPERWMSDHFGVSVELS